jgi:hypothetical protein
MDVKLDALKSIMERVRLVIQLLPVDVQRLFVISTSLILTVMLQMAVKLGVLQ